MWEHLGETGRFRGVITALDPSARRVVRSLLHRRAVITTPRHFGNCLQFCIQFVDQLRSVAFPVSRVLQLVPD